MEGTRKAINELLAYLKSNKHLSDLDVKASCNETNLFHRTKVRLQKQLVTLGIEGIETRHTVGTYVEPKDWNKPISDPETVLLDTRNDYEAGISTFKNAVNPETETFRESPEYVEQNLDPSKDRKERERQGELACAHG